MGGGGSLHKFDYFRGSFPYILGLLRSRYRMEIFFVAAKFQIFLGISDIPGVFLLFFFYCFFFWGGGVCKPMYAEKLRVSPGVSLGTDLYIYSSLVWRAQD